MIRRVIQIDEEKCNGCGACVKACHEGAIGLVNGKAKLMRDDYCDGLGDCLPNCPTNAISFVEREAAAYDEAAVMRAKAAKKAPAVSGGCPGARAAVIKRAVCECCGSTNESGSCLTQWPVQIKLMPVTAPYYSGRDVLVAADCAAYAHGSFHSIFIKDRIVMIGCPKLDSIDYSDKLTQIFASNDIRSVTVVRMIVPCCGGLEMAVKKAASACGKDIAVKTVTISTDGQIVNEK